MAHFRILVFEMWFMIRAEKIWDMEIKIVWDLRQGLNRVSMQYLVFDIEIRLFLRFAHHWLTCKWCHSSGNVLLEVGGVQNLVPVVSDLRDPRWVIYSGPVDILHPLSLCISRLFFPSFCWSATDAILRASSLRRVQNPFTLLSSQLHRQASCTLRTRLNMSLTAIGHCFRDYSSTV